jgi:hypothetical protein
MRRAHIKRWRHGWLFGIRIRAMQTGRVARFVSGGVLVVHAVVSVLAVLVLLAPNALFGRDAGVAHVQLNVTALEHALANVSLGLPPAPAVNTSVVHPLADARTNSSATLPSGPPIPSFEPRLRRRRHKRRVLTSPPNSL